MCRSLATAELVYLFFEEEAARILGMYVWWISTGRRKGSNSENTHMKVDCFGVCSSHVTLPSARRHPAQPVSAPIFQCWTEEVLWSQSYATEILRCHVPGTQ